MTNPTGPTGPGTPGEALASAASATIERQLTQFLASVTKQIEGVRESAAHTIAALQSEIERRLDVLSTRLDVVQNANDSFRQSLTTALEDQLAEYAETMQARLDDLDRRLRLIPAGAVDATELAALREQFDGQLGVAHGRIDDLHKATRRFDEQAAAMVQHVNDVNMVLTQRLDESTHGLAAAVEERLAAVRHALETLGPNIQHQLSEQTNAISQRLEVADDAVTDRLLALEERINETQGTRIAQLEATVGRVGAGFDEAIGAVSHRLLELDDKLAAYDRLAAEFDQRLGSIDQSGLDQLKEQMSSAVGEAMLVRIELDRAMAETADRLDKANVRMAEIEGLLSDEMDVNATVQLERLEEIERALAELDPERFAAERVTARSTAPTAAAPAAAAPAAPVAAPTLAEPTHADAAFLAAAPPMPPVAPGAAGAHLPLTLPASWGVTPLLPEPGAAAPSAPAMAPHLAEPPRIAPKVPGAPGPLSARLSAAGSPAAPADPTPAAGWPAVPSTENDPHPPDDAAGRESAD